MKRMFVLALAAVTLACNKNISLVVDDVETALGELSVTMQMEAVMSKSIEDEYALLDGEKVVNSVSVLVFDKKSTCLAAAMTVRSITEKCTMSLPEGEKTVYVVVNHPDVSSVTEIADVQNLADDLTVTSLRSDGLMMIGTADCIVLAGKTAEAYVALKRLVSRVVLQKVTCSLPSQYKDMRLDCVFLGNANTKQDFCGISSVMQNRKGYFGNPSYPIGKGTTVGACPEYFYRAAGEVIVNGDSSKDKYYLYCQPDSSEDVTCMYLLMTIGTEQFYYIVPLYNGLRSNHTYSVDVEIVNLGSDLPPDGETGKGELKAFVEFRPWDAGDSYDVIF